MEMILVERLMSSVGGMIERADIKSSGAGYCDDIGSCRPGDSVGETTHYVRGWESLEFSDDEVGETKARPHIVSAYDPDDWDEFYEDEAFNEAVSHSGANVATLGIPAAVETATAIYEDARAGNVPSIDRYAEAFVDGVVDLVRRASSDRVGADRGAARGALVGMGLETAAGALVGGLANTGPGGPIMRRPGTVVTKDGCFDPSTLVWTPAGLVAIADVQVGDAVLPYVSGCESEWPDDPVTLTYVSTDRSDLVVEMVGSARTALLVGDVEHLDVPALGVSGTFEIVGRAPVARRVGEVGCPVLGRVRRIVADTLEVVVGGGDRLERIITTAEHPFLSSDRGEWVPAGELLVNEQLASDLANLRVVDSQVTAGGEVVNLWVGGSNRYLVGQLGVEVHNTCWLVRVMRARGIGVPSWMQNLRPHGHHIIPKGLNRARGPRLARVVTNLQDLARRFNIDLVNDMDNLTIAPNGTGTHSVAALERIYERLSAQAGSEAAFRAELRAIGRDIYDGDFYLEFSHRSNPFSP